MSSEEAAEARAWLDSLDEVVDDPARQQFLWGSREAYAEERRDAFWVFLVLHSDAPDPAELSEARGVLQRHAEARNRHVSSARGALGPAAVAQAPATGKHPDPAVQARIESEAAHLKGLVDQLVSGRYAVPRERMAAQVSASARRLALLGGYGVGA